MAEIYTLPINLSNGISCDNEMAFSEGVLLRSIYNDANPYPHIVIDDFLPQQLIDVLERYFPEKITEREVQYEAGYAGQHKRQISPEACCEEVKKIFSFLNGAGFLRFLEGVSGIEGLIPDPYFNGGGFHETSAGGKLGIHADFRLNTKLHLSRRLNVIIYLNDDWDDSYGGHLEIWDRHGQKCVNRVLPIKNRCVIFNTDENSYHGHPDPLTPPENRKRRSVALYYYTASKKIYIETPAHTTDYVARKDDGLVDKAAAFKFKLINALVDWIPPAIARRVLK